MTTDRFRLFTLSDRAQPTRPEYEELLLGLRQDPTFRRVLWPRVLELTTNSDDIIDGVTDPELRQMTLERVGELARTLDPTQGQELADQLTTSVWTHVKDNESCRAAIWHILEQVEERNEPNQIRRMKLFPERAKQLWDQFWRNRHNRIEPELLHKLLAIDHLAPIVIHHIRLRRPAWL